MDEILYTAEGASFKLGVAQLSYADNDKEGNTRKACQAIREASELQVRLLVFPEKYLTGFLDSDQLVGGSEPLEGRFLSEILDCAAEHRVGVVMGLTEKYGESGEYYNTNVVTGPDGSILTVYRKTHLYGAREHALLKPGVTLDTSLFTIDGVTCATLICYDFEFPEAVRTVVLRGAQCVLVSSGNWFGLERSQRSQRFTRAIENQIFLGYSMRTGSNGTYEFHGDSAIVDPYGTCLAFAELEETILSTTINTHVIEECVKEFSYCADRRPELYEH